MGGIPMSSSDKAFAVMNAMGNIIFAYSFSMILIVSVWWGWGGRGCRSVLRPGVERAGRQQFSPRPSKSRGLNC